VAKIMYRRTLQELDRYVWWASRPGEAKELLNRALDIKDAELGEP